MDELNVQQCWGITPFIDLLQAASAAGAALPDQQQQGGDQVEQQQLAFMQVCPYDCRHSLATMSNQARCAAAAANAASSGHQVQQQQLQLYVFEAEPEALARHMLLLMALFDATLTARERAEMFLELHGNVLLRQRTADWACAASKQLEAAMAGLADKQQQQQQGSPAEAVLDLFDLSMLKYKERDVLLETFQHYRVKSGFDVAAAWEGRCRKWYGDRYDFRHNMVDWDYHMRLSPRGTPFLDPALGSIIHFFHFRHWRLTGVAYELRESSYTATNTSMLSTAYGRTREYKDRYLRDVGRSVAAYGFWGDVLNPPYHAFGTVSDAPALLQQVNKQFSHTSVDVAEHNVLGFIQRLCGPTIAATAAAAAAAGTSAGASHCGKAEDSSSNPTQTHRARAARGPTSLENLTAAQPQRDHQHDQQQQEALAGEAQVQGEAGNGSSTPAVLVKGGSADAAGSKGSSAVAEPGPDAAGTVDQSTEQLQGLSVQQQSEPSLGAPHQQQQQQADAADTAAQQQAAAEFAQMAAAVQSLGSVKIVLLTGDLRRVLTGKAAFAGRFAAATVGHRHVHLLGAEAGLADVLRPGAPVFVETAANMVQLNNEQVAAFECKLLELAAAAGFRPHTAFSSHPQQQPKQEQQLQQQGKAEQGAQAAAGSEGGAPLPKSRTTDGSCWQLPAGHLALCVGSSEEVCC